MICFHELQPALKSLEKEKTLFQTKTKRSNDFGFLFFLRLVPQNVKAWLTYLVLFEGSIAFYINHLLERVQPLAFHCNDDFRSVNHLQGDKCSI